MQVQPLTVVDKSDISPTGLTFPLDGPYSSFSDGNDSFSSSQIKRIHMNHQVFLLTIFLIFSSFAAVCSWLAPSWSCPVENSWQATQQASPSAASPRCPDDCPACRLASPASSARGPAPQPVRPWREVKSRRGAPKRVNTEGFACPNQQCLSFGNTNSQIHALVGDGKHGRAEQIQTLRCQACRTTFSARRDTPFYRLKTPSHQVAMVLTALAEGLDPSAAERVFGSRQATITTWLTRAGEHAQTLHGRSDLAICTSHTCSWTNSEHGCAAISRYSGSGWRSTLAPSFFPCSIWPPVPKTQRRK
jgi:transposase-like protein